jgi:hypothetical protein
MEVTPSALDFGALELGETFAQSFVISNPGADALEVSDLDIDGDMAFTLVTPPAAPFIIEPGDAVMVDVLYTSGNVGEVAVVTVMGDAPETPEATVELTGTWAQPALCVNPESVMFGDLPPLCIEEQTVLLESCGEGDLTIDLVAISGDLSLGFVDEAAPAPMVLAPGEAVSVRVQFAPEGEGEHAALLVVDSDDPGGLREIDMSGRSAEGLLCDGIGEYEFEMEAEYQLADIAFLLDLGKWHTALSPDLAADLAEVTADIRAEIPDVTFGVASYRDYQPYGYDMYPYQLEQQQTDDVALVSTALRSLSYSGWSSGYATGFEAVHQAASGHGYDELCDGSYNSSTDALPFISSPLDAFNGVVAGTEDVTTPGTGRSGGMGFRTDVLPIFVLVTHSKIRDPGAGDPAPGGCSIDADMYQAYASVAELGGKVIGVWGDAGISFPTTRDQLEQLAIITDSYFDIDGDLIREPAVVPWDGSDYQFKKVLVDGVLSLAGNALFDKVELELDDPHGVILSVTPESYSPAAAGDPVPFTLELEGEVLPTPEVGTVEVVARLIADDTVLLSQRTLYVMPE